jgi:hypothetical protein
MYTFTVIALATFLVGIAIGYRPQTLYSVSASILYQRPTKHGSSDDKTAAIGRITTGRSLRAAAQQAGLLGARTPSDSPVDLDDTIDRLRKQIAVRTRKGEGPGQTLIDLRYTGNEEQGALKLVDLLAGQFVRDVTAAA